MNREKKQRESTLPEFVDGAHHLFLYTIGFAGLVISFEYIGVDSLTDIEVLLLFIPAVFFYVGLIVQALFKVFEHSSWEGVGILKEKVRRDEDEQN